jgi:Na+:H+ antiporter, NhaA family
VTAPPAPRRLFGRISRPEQRFVADALRTETVGGALLLLAAIVGIVWANSPWRAAYASFQQYTPGSDALHALHLNLTLEEWAADGLLAIFFFVAGIELKREFVVGELRDRRKAILPVAAAACGVIMPAVLYVGVVTLGRGSGDNDLLRGWAVPTATDIAFALAVLAILGTHLPSALRSFLLTLAVVDDLIAILIIAVFYTDHLSPLPLLAALVPLIGFWFAARRLPTPWLLIPLALLSWGLVHASGIHATVAGVTLGLLLPCTITQPHHESLGERVEHRVRPLSAGVAVPIFALLSAGVTLGGTTGLVASIKDPAAVGVIVGLVAGKPIGIFAGTWLLARFTRARLDDDLAWLDVFGVAVLSGIGFTVSLLIGELAFGANTLRDEHVKFGVLTASVLAALLAAVVLRQRNRHYRALDRVDALASADADGLGGSASTASGTEASADGASSRGSQVGQDTDRPGPA